jgi:hypothetical protein
MFYVGAKAPTPVALPMFYKSGKQQRQKFLQGLKPNTGKPLTLGLKPQPPKEKAGLNLHEKGGLKLRPSVAPFMASQQWH